MRDLDVMSWRFLRSVGWWAAGLAVAAAVVGALVTGGGYSFAVPAVIGGGLDVLSFAWIVDRGEEVSNDDPVRGVRLAASWVAVRMLLKVGVLAWIATIAPVSSLIGMLVGLLVVDVTILVRGSAEVMAKALH